MNTTTENTNLQTTSTPVGTESNGTVRFSSDVLSKICMTAAAQVRGVENVAISTLSVEEAGVTIALSFAAGYQVPLLEAAHQVQQSVKDAIQNMTGLMVSAVNVTVKAIIL
jgi:uncharacterized alkaline shock family protein YloU